MSEPALRILVTDAQELAGLGAIRSFGRAGHLVVAGYPRGMPRPPATYSRYCRASLTYPEPWQHNDLFGQWLVDELSRGAYDVLLPTTEATIAAAAARRQELEPRAELLLPSDEHLRYTLSKYQATRAALEAGLAIPKTIFVREAGQPAGASADLPSLRFPIIIKTDNYLRGDGCYVRGSAHSAATPAEAAAILDPLRDSPTSIIAQEKIPGHGVGAFLLRHRRRSVLRFAHKRLHEVPYTGGMSSLRASSRDETVIAEAEKLLAAIDYEGVAMVEFRQQADDEIPYFLEINGRLWGSLALAQHAGVDFPRAWLECQRSGVTSVRQPRYPAGLKCRDTVPRELLYVKSVLSARRGVAEPEPPSKAYALLEFILLSMDPRVRSDTFWLSDPSPGLIVLYQAGRDLLGRVLRQPLRVLRAAGDRRLLRQARHLHEQRARLAAYFVEPMSKILFLCYGNICRSAFAERYWNERVREQRPNSPLACSAGFFERENRPAAPHCAVLAQRLGVDLESHRSRLVSHQLVQEADAIFVMDLKNYRDLKRAFPDVLGKTYFLGLFDRDGMIEIADPYPLALPEAARSYEQLVRALDGLSEAMPQR